MSAELSADNLSSLMAERLTDEQTSVLMEKFAEVMKKCEEDGINRDEELKQSQSLRPDPRRSVCFILPLTGLLVRI